MSTNSPTPPAKLGASVGLPAESEPAKAQQAPSQPDELAQFFVTPADVSTDKATAGADKPVVVDADLIAEAQKDASTRQAEITAALADHEGSEVAPCIEFGQNMLAQSADSRFGDAQNILGATVNTALQHTEQETLDDAIRIIGERIDNLSHGQDNIFRPVDDKADLQNEGTRRRAGQRELQNLRAVTLGLSTRAFETGDYHRGINALQASGVGNVVDGAPGWYYDQVADALASANLDDPAVRAEVLRIEARGMCGFTAEDRKQVASGEPTNSVQRIAQVAVKARDIQTREDTRIAQEQAEHAYQTRLSEAWNEKMNDSVDDGERQFAEHLRSGRDYQVRFASYGRGSSMLHLISSEYRLFNEVAEIDGRRAGGAMGYVETLGRMMDTPGFMDKAVKLLSEKVFSDLGGRMKSDYEGAGSIADWESHLQQQVMSEIYGNLFGCLRGAIQMQESQGWGPTSDMLINRILMVAGRGQAESMLLSDKGLSREQVQFRNALAEYMKSLKVVESDPSTHRNTEYLKKAQGLRTQAHKADGDFKAEEMRKAEAARRKLEAEETERQGLAGKAKESKAKLDSIREKREKMLDARVRGDRCRALEDAKAEDYVRVVEGKDGKTPIVTVTINEERRRALTERRQRVDAGLQQAGLAPERRRELRDEQAECDIESQFIQRIERSLPQLNASEHRRQKPAKGIMPRQVGAIASDAFERVANVERRTYEIIGSNWSGVINQAMEEIDRPRATTSIKSLGTISDLSSMVDAQIGASDPLAMRSEILSVADDILRRDVQAGSTLRELDGKVSQALEASARVFIKETLNNYLSRSGHLKY